MAEERTGGIDLRPASPEAARRVVETLDWIIGRTGPVTEADFAGLREAKARFDRFTAMEGEDGTDSH